jgi:hypothetical protein
MGTEVQTSSFRSTSGSSSSSPTERAIHHFELPTEINVRQDENDADGLVEWFRPIIMESATLSDILNLSFDRTPRTGNSGMPSETTLEDDITHPDLVFVKYVVSQIESFGITPDSNTLNGISGVDFADAEFVEQAYDWVEDLKTSNPGFAVDVENWLAANGAMTPVSLPPHLDLMFLLHRL